MDERRRVAVTGAAGRIGRAITPFLAERWDLHLTDLSVTAAGRGEGVTGLDVTDLDACRAAFAGVDAVVHLAGEPDPDARWATLHPANLVGVHHVAQAAMDCRVRRLVLASSLHAVSMRTAPRQVRPEDAPRPSNLYGATKAWAEAVGSWVTAVSATSVVALRIGYFAVDQPDPDQTPPVELSAWLSAGDAAELVRAAVEAPGDDFVIVNGTSDNRYARADIGPTKTLLGYRPVDDAWAE